MASLRALITAALAATATALPGSPVSSTASTSSTITPNPSSSSAFTSAIPSSSSSSSSSSPSPPASGFSFTPAPSDQHTCGPPSFHAEPPGASLPAASWRHCAALFSSWASRRGTFAVGGAGTPNATLLVPLLAGRGCVLGVRAAERGGGNGLGNGGNGGRGRSGAWLTVGDADVKGIMRTALEEWSRGTELEVQGEVVCEADGGGTGGLWWQIYGDEGAGRSR